MEEVRELNPAPLEVKYMPVSEAQKKASVKYLEKLDEVRIRMPKGKKDDVKAAAVAVGESMNQYIINAVEQRMERDGPTRPQEAAGAALGAVAVSLPSEAVETAQKAAK